MHGGEGLLCHLGDIGCCRWIEAEVAQHRNPPASFTKVPTHGGRRTGTVEHGVELTQLAHLHRFDRVIDVARSQCGAFAGKIGGRNKA